MCTWGTWRGGGWGTGTGHAVPQVVHTAPLLTLADYRRRRLSQFVAGEALFPLPQTSLDSLAAGEELASRMEAFRAELDGHREALVGASEAQKQHRRIVEGARRRAKARLRAEATMDMLARRSHRDAVLAATSLSGSALGVEPQGEGEGEGAAAEASVAEASGASADMSGARASQLDEEAETLRAAREQLAAAQQRLVALKDAQDEEYLARQALLEAHANLIQDEKVSLEMRRSELDEAAARLSLARRELDEERSRLADLRQVQAASPLAASPLAASPMRSRLRYDNDIYPSPVSASPGSPSSGGVGGSPPLSLGSLGASLPAVSLPPPPSTAPPHGGYVPPYTAQGTVPLYIYEQQLAEQKLRLAQLQEETMLIANDA